MRISFSCLLAFLFIISTTDSLKLKSNDGPTIGVLTSPRSGIHHPESEIKISNYEFLLAGGDVNVIPIPWDLETRRFNQLLNQVNGILLTGGNSPLWEEDEEGNRSFSPYQRTVNYVLYHVMKKNRSGVYFPLWGICEGFEAVAIALTKDVFILDTFNHDEVYDPITFTNEVQRSKMFKEFSKEDFEFAEKSPAVYYKHTYGLNTSVPTLYSAFSKDKWIITSINEDENGKEFINSMEMKDFPIFLHMFHPERALHDALYHKNFPSAPQVVSLATKLAQAFLTEAKENDSGFVDPGLKEALLIQNFDQEDEYYVFTINIFKNHWFSVHENIVDMVMWGALGVVAALMVGCVVYAYLQKHKKENPRVNYERIERIDSIKV